MPCWGRIIRVLLAGGMCLAFCSPPLLMTAQPKDSSILEDTQVMTDRTGMASKEGRSEAEEGASRAGSRTPDDENRAKSLESASAGPADKGTWVVRFAHGTHDKHGCLTCHEGTSKEQPGSVKVQACFDCHSEKIASGKCGDCHGKDRFLPTNHKPVGKWRKRHGYRANVLVFPDRRSWNRVETGHVYDCSGCHVDDQCRKCHQLNRPDSHTGFWRIRGHGIRGLAERESCAVCHVEMFCVRCHKTTRPINHVGNWNTLHGRAVSQSTAERCWVCHPRVISRVRVGNTPECNYCHPE